MSEASERRYARNSPETRTIKLRAKPTASSQKKKNIFPPKRDVEFCRRANAPFSYPIRIGQY